MSFGKHVKLLKLLFAKRELICRSSNAGSTDLGNNGEVESELSDEIERARNEGMQRAASERDSSSGPDAVFSPDLENAIESWQDRFRHKRKRSDLLTLEGLREENSRMTKRPRHPGK